MGGCIGREEIPQRNDLIIDVQQIIADDAWEEFVFTSRRMCRLRYRKMKRSDYVIEVPMNYYHFQVTDQKFRSKKPLPSLHSNDSSRKGQSSHALTNRASPEQLGLKTEFRNDTDKDQTYNFRMEKTRKATVQVSYQKGFSIGGSTNFTLGLPKVMAGGELSAETHMTYEITSSSGQMFEETLTTEATSEIVVSEQRHCTAQVVLEERRLLADFTVKVEMQMPEKAAVVLIKDKTGRQVFLKHITNLSMLFPSHTHIRKEPDNPRNQDVRPDAVRFLIHGFVDGMQLSNHYIHLKSRPIPPGAKSSKGKSTQGDTSGHSDEKSDENDFPDLQKMGFKPGF